MNEDNARRIVALLLVVSILISVAGTMLVAQKANSSADIVQVHAGNNKGTIGFTVGDDTGTASGPSYDIGTGNLVLTII